MSDEFEYRFFYVKKEYQDEIQLKDSLYAYTDDKRLAKKFKDTRDMRKFDYVKRWISRFEVNELARFHQNEFLREFELQTKTGDLGSESISVKLVMTQSEFTLTESFCQNIFLNKIWNSASVNPRIFKEKYFTSLIESGYYDIYAVLSHKLSQDYYAEITNQMKPDYVSSFIHQFKNTLLI